MTFTATATLRRQSCWSSTPNPQTRHWLSRHAWTASAICDGAEPCKKLFSSWEPHWGKIGKTNVLIITIALCVPKNNHHSTAINTKTHSRTPKYLDQLQRNHRDNKTYTVHFYMLSHCRCLCPRQKYEYLTEILKTVSRNSKVCWNMTFGITVTCIFRRTHWLQVTPKRQYLSTKLHDVRSQTTMSYVKTPPVKGVNTAFSAQ